MTDSHSLHLPDSMVNDLERNPHRDGTVEETPRRRPDTPWNVDDVMDVRPDLTVDQAWQVLQEIEDKHDMIPGFAWYLLDHHADRLFGPPPE